MNKIYKLLKDLPDAPKGTSVIWNDSNKCYFIHGNVQYNAYSKEVVEENPDWFAEEKSTLSEIIEECFGEPNNDVPTLTGSAKFRAEHACKRYAYSLLNELTEKLQAHKAPENFLHREPMRMFSTNSFIDECISEISSLIKETE